MVAGDINDVAEKFTIDQDSRQARYLIEKLEHTSLKAMLCLQLKFDDIEWNLFSGKLLYVTALDAATKQSNMPFHQYCLVASIERYQHVLLNNRLNDDYRRQIMRELAKPMAIMSEGTNYWNDRKILRIEQPKFVVTMTTCNRLQLFIKTVQSFLVCCSDLDVIGEWIVVDDNSSKDDRAMMVEMFPWMTFIMKTPEQRGHAKSMNMLRDYVLTKSSIKYIIHLEDDWKFMCKLDLLSRSECILDDDPLIGQVLFNLNYAETQDDIHIGGKLQGANKTLRIEHSYKTFFGKNNAVEFWPHFSLRPNIIRKDVWLRVGEFEEGVKHFEMSYAYRYITDGWKTAFLPTISCIHTGRLCGDEGDNAYSLNGQTQFQGNDLPDIVFCECDMSDEGVKRLMKRCKRMREKRWIIGNQDGPIAKYILNMSLNNVDWSLLLINNGTVGGTLKVKWVDELPKGMRTIAVNHKWLQTMTFPTKIYIYDII